MKATSMLLWEGARLLQIGRQLGHGEGGIAVITHRIEQGH